MHIRDQISDHWLLSFNMRYSEVVIVVALVLVLDFKFSGRPCYLFSGHFVDVLNLLPYNVLCSI